MKTCGPTAYVNDLDLVLDHPLRDDNFPAPLPEGVTVWEGDSDDDDEVSGMFAVTHVTKAFRRLLIGPWQFNESYYLCRSRESAGRLAATLRRGGTAGDSYADWARPV